MGVRGFKGAVVTLALVGTVTGCAAPSAQSPSTGSPSTTPTPTAAPTPTPKPEYQAFEDLAIGDCFDPLKDRDDDGLIGGIVRRCDEQHLMEVIGIPTLEYADSALYPAQAELDRQSEDVCRAEFKVYVGIDFDDSRLAATYYQPSEETWAMGDRLVLCVVEAPEVAPLTRSVRDSAQ